MRYKKLLKFFAISIPICIGCLFINTNKVEAEFSWTAANEKFLKSIKGCGQDFYKSGYGCIPKISYYKQSVANTGEPYTPSLTTVSSGVSTVCPSSGKSKSGTKAYTIYKQGSTTGMTFLMTITWKISCDTVKPKLTAVADNKCYSVGTPVTRSWKCTDSGGSGCAAGTYSTTTTGNTASVTGYDKAYSGGNATISSSVTINRDGTGPSKTIGVISTSACTTSLNLWGRCLADSGCAGCGADTYYGQITANGTYYYTAKDSVGNATTGAATITNIDRNPPECGDIVYPNKSYYYKSSFNVGAKCVNDGSCSGCSKSTFTESKNTPSGTVAIWDTLGNVRACTYSGVKVDTTAPTTTIKFNDAYTADTEKYQASEEIEVLISATDNSNGSGVNRVCYRMSGATNIGDTCVNGSSTKVYVSAEGRTAITAWSYDNARDYVSATNSGSYNANTGGNKSSNVSLNAYVDYTAPTINISSNNDGKTWSNKATPVTVNITDAGSGIGYYRYYWSTTDSDIYDESTALYRSGSGNVVNTTLSTNASGNWYNSRTITETNPTNLAHNDVIYLHVQACDRSFYKNNCSTKTYKVGIHFDNVKPETPTLSSMSQEWVNKYQLTINTSEFIQTNKQNSGLNTIYTYWDTNINHQEASFTRENSSYSSTANLTNANPSNTYTAKYNWTIDFANLKNMLKNGAESSVGAATEGSRFIRIRVTDIAGNWSDYLTAGPFKWDTTSPIAEITDITGDERTFLPAENNQ